MLTPCPECGHRLWSEIESFGAFRTVVFFASEEGENDAGLERVKRCPGCGLRLQTLAIEPGGGASPSKTMHVLANADNAATLAWLEYALREALAGGRLALAGYLEAVLEDVMLELELTSPPPPGLP